MIQFESLKHIETLAESLLQCLHALPEEISEEFNINLTEHVLNQLISSCRSKIENQVIEQMKKEIDIEDTFDNGNVKEENNSFTFDDNHNSDDGEGFQRIRIKVEPELCPDYTELDPDFDDLKEENNSGKQPKIKPKRKRLRPKVKERKIPVHARDHWNYKYNCIFCEANFESQSEHYSHDEQCHIRDSKYFCPYENCSFTDESKILTMNHFAENHNPLKCMRNLKYCPHCKQAFSLIKHLKRHLLELHEIDHPINNCLICGDEFQNERRAQHHMESVHYHHKVRCMKSRDSCTEEFDDMQALKAHLSLHTAPSSIMTCHICGKEFRVNSMFRRHVMEHSLTEKKFECNVCGEKFFFEFDLKLHTRKEHLKCFFCDKCNFNTYTSGKLRRHMEIHSEELAHTCVVCGRGFTTKKYLEKHIAVHSDERKHKCDTCGKAFKHSKNLIVHRRIHTNDYQCVCKVCDRPFIQKTNLKIHMKKHHPEVDEKFYY